MKYLTNLTPTAAFLITAALMLGTFILVGVDLIDSKSADTLIAFLLGGGGGAAIVGGLSKGGGV